MNDSAPGLFTPGMANHKSRWLMAIGTIIGILGLHWKSGETLFFGVGVVIVASFYDLFVRRGSIIGKVIIALAMTAVLFIAVIDPHQAYLWIQSLGKHAGHFITPNWKPTHP